MQFTQIPPEAMVQRPWLKHQPIGPPPGQEEHIGTLSALVGEETSPDVGTHPVIRFCAEATPEDIEALQRGEKVWIEIWSPVMFPISIAVGAT